MTRANPSPTQARNEELPMPRTPERTSYLRAGVALATLWLAWPGGRALAEPTQGGGDKAKAESVSHSGYGPDSADRLAAMAIAANPSLRAIEERVGALEQKVRQAGAWLEPSISAEYSSMPIDRPLLGEHAMSGIQVMLKQTLYWPGKIGAREEEAGDRVRQEQLTLAEQKVQLQATVKRAYYRLALTRQLRDVTRENVQLVSDFADVVRVKVETGLAAQHELLRLRVLVGRLEDDLKSYDQDESSLTAAINATLHRDIDIPVPTPKQTPVGEPVADATALAQRAEKERPLLRSYVAERETYLASARRAKREGYPDITLWAGYRVRTRAGADPGRDFVSFGLSLPLPLSYDARWGSERRHDEALAEAALQKRAAAVDEIRGRLGQIVAGWKRAVQEAHTYRKDLIPNARLSLDATYSSYQVGRADFASLFQAELELLNFERTARMAETAAAQARVDAEAMVGTGVE
jgi:cobalt-zinc-cadmium efflux system outer membrane protein